MTPPQAPEEIAAVKYADNEMATRDVDQELYDGDLVDAFLAGSKFQKKRAEGLVEALEKISRSYRLWLGEENGRMKKHTEPTFDADIAIEALARYREGGKI